MGHYFSSFEATSGYNRWCAQKIECMFEVYVPPFFLASVLFGVVCSIYYSLRWGSWTQAWASVRHFSWYPMMLDLNATGEIKEAVALRDWKLKQETMSVLEQELIEAQLEAIEAAKAEAIYFGRTTTTTAAGGSNINDERYATDYGYGDQKFDVFG